MKKNLPTFLGIGAQKAGTTWLYKKLVQHPEIWIPPKKELHFFDNSSHYLKANPLARVFSSTPSQRKRMMHETKKIGKYLLELRLLTAKWSIQLKDEIYLFTPFKRLVNLGLPKE